MLNSLLIANRGEIACRIISTAQRMGIETIAVFSEADRNSLHVKLADKAVFIGASAASESYLDADAIIEAALGSGAEAIHPGYGFLSEQPDLVEKCAKHGLVWIGPHIKAIRSMGSKIEAKQIALDANVPCIPGTNGKDQSDKALIDTAKSTGLPVMIKASAGGGGKGMRPVFDEAALPDAVSSARIEAERSFGDGRLLIEKLIRKPRHIEIQVLGDKHGNLIHLYERDCSIQRNHQKVIEECPAYNLDKEIRDGLIDAALNLSGAINYDSVGTIEFIVDGDNGDYFFLEMNTRLQVEHTVTEEVTRIDLVEQQILAAVGNEIRLSQQDIKCCGHAIQVRLTAEDPQHGFAPDTGMIHVWNPDPNIRCDSYMEAGATISPYYDSLIAKLIAYGVDRSEARSKLVRALASLDVAGVQTNRLFLRDILKSTRFTTEATNTDFLEQEWPDGWKPKTVNEVIDSFVIAALARHVKPADNSSPWNNLNGFRLLQNSGHGASTTYTDQENRSLEVSLIQKSDCIKIEYGTETAEINWQWEDEHLLVLTHDNTRQQIRLFIEDGTIYVWGDDFEGKHQIVTLANYRELETANGQVQDDQLAAPMPGLILEVKVSPGDQVKQSEIMVSMESMKLVMDLKSGIDGCVETIHVQPGDVVEQGALLVELNSSEASDVA